MTEILSLAICAMEELTKGTNMIEAWKFLHDDRRLGYGDGRLVEVGVTLTVDGPPLLCERGIHASRRAIDALQYAETAIVARVACEGEIVEGVDKLACTRLTPLAIFDASDTLRAFARACALDVIHLWDAPDIVRRYLDTGDESLRAAAQDVLRASIWDHPRDAARAAARDVPQNAALAAARDAAQAIVAQDAALAIEWAAARDAQNVRLEQMLIEI